MDKTRCYCFLLTKERNLNILCGSKVLTHSSWMPEADHAALNMRECDENIELIPLPQLPKSIQRRLGGNTSSGITEFWVGLHLVQEQEVECFQWIVGIAADFPCH